MITEKPAPPTVTQVIERNGVDRWHAWAAFRDLEKHFDIVPKADG